MNGSTDFHGNMQLADVNTVDLYQENVLARMQLEQLVASQGDAGLMNVSTSVHGTLPGDIITHQAALQTSYLQTPMMQDPVLTQQAQMSADPVLFQHSLK
jgi:hypothetical protein